MSLTESVLNRLLGLLGQPTAHERTARRFRAAGGEALRYRYRLDPGDLILDLGGYHGDWTAGMLDRFSECRSIIFEPVRTYYDDLKGRFSEDDRVSVCPFGLGARHRTDEIVLADDSSSLFVASGPREEVEIVDVVEWWKAANVERVAVMKVNIEGGEYEVLPRLISSGLIARVDALQVQFHRVVPNARRRMKAILDDLAATHQATYRFPFVWENWRLREPT